MKFVSLVLLIVWDRQCQSLPTPGCPGGFARHDPPYDGECCRILHCPPGTVLIYLNYIINEESLEQLEEQFFRPL